MASYRCVDADADPDALKGFAEAQVSEVASPPVTTFP